MITKKNKITEIVEKHPEVSEIMFKYGMHCVGCVAATFETLEEGCKAHGMGDKEIDKMVKEINNLLKKK